MPVAPVASASPVGERQFSLPDEAATLAFGKRFAAALRADCSGSADTRKNAGTETTMPRDTVATAATPHSWVGLHVHLLGDLGAGKTTLVRATLHALGHRGRVRSPTYTLVEPYRIGIAGPDDRAAPDHPAPDRASPDTLQPARGEGRDQADGRLDTRAYDVYHFDLYRFADPAEWADAGFREYFNAGALCLVEWPQKAGTLIGVPDLSLTLDLADDGRVLTARAYSARGKECLDRC